MVHKDSFLKNYPITPRRKWLFSRVRAFDVLLDYEIIELEFKCGTGDEQNEFAIYFGTIR